jgi:hypothetical protein
MLQTAAAVMRDAFAGLGRRHEPLILTSLCETCIIVPCSSWYFISIFNVHSLLDHASVPPRVGDGILCIVNMCSTRTWMADVGNTYTTPTQISRNYQMIQGLSSCSFFIFSHYGHHTILVRTERGFSVSVFSSAVALPAIVSVSPVPIPAPAPSFTPVVLSFSTSAPPVIAPVPRFQIPTLASRVVVSLLAFPVSTIAITAADLIFSSVPISASMFVSTSKFSFTFTAEECTSRLPLL